MADFADYQQALDDLIAVRNQLVAYMQGDENTEVQLPGGGSYNSIRKSMAAVDAQVAQAIGQIGDAMPPAPDDGKRYVAKGNLWVEGNFDQGGSGPGDPVSPVLVVLASVQAGSASPAIVAKVAGDPDSVTLQIAGASYAMTVTGKTATVAAGTIGPLADNAYAMTATASKAGVDSDSDSATLTVDTSVAVTPITVNVDNANAATASPELTCTTTGNPDSVTFRVEGQNYPATGSGNTWTVAAGTMADLSNGGHGVTATATKAGTADATDTATLTIALPVAPITVTLEDKQTADVSPKLTGTCTGDPESVTIQVDDGNPYAATISGDTWTLGAGVIADLSYAAHAVTVTATKAGTADATDTATLTVTDPVIAITVSIDGDSVSVASPAVSGICTGNPDTVTYTIEGSDYPATISGNSWTIAAGIIADLDEGSHPVTVTATKAGEIDAADTATLIVVLSVTAPTNPATTSTESARPDLWASPLSGGLVYNGNAVDEFEGTNASLVGSPSIVSTTAGDALRLNYGSTTGQTIDAPYVSLDGLSSLSYWVYAKHTNGDSEYNALGIQWDDNQGAKDLNAQRILFGYYKTENSLDFAAQLQGVSELVTWRKPISLDDAPHVIGFDWDGTTVDIFFDGAVVDSFPMSGILETASNAKHPEIMGGQRTTGTSDKGHTNSPNFDLYAWGLNSTALGAQAHADIAADPFAAFRRS